MVGRPARMGGRGFVRSLVHQAAECSVDGGQSHAVMDTGLMEGCSDGVGWDGWRKAGLKGEGWHVAAVGKQRVTPCESWKER